MIEVSQARNPGLGPAVDEGAEVVGDGGSHGGVEIPGAACYLNVGGGRRVEQGVEQVSGPIAPR